MRIFAFGLGYTARRVLARLPGVEASGATRDSETARAWRRDGVAAWAVDDLAGLPALEAALRGAETLLVSAPPDENGDPALQRFGGTIAAAPALARVVYLSSVGVYGDRDGGWVDELSAPAPGSPRARWRLAAEREWRAFADARDARVDILRLAGVYGPGRNAVEKLRRGEARRIVKPGQVFNRIHVDDIAAVAVRLIEADGPGGIWNVADEEPAPPEDVIVFAAELLGVAPPPIEDFATARLTPMARSFYDDNRRVDVGKLRRELGYRWLYPTYRDGLRALAAAEEGRATT
ncbi:MAG: SDR family oxidoreductase [Roseiarcus sp.]|jgi:nucleoside-diphosphate-sugar epimerase